MKETERHIHLNISSVGNMGEKIYSPHPSYKGIPATQSFAGDSNEAVRSGVENIGRKQPTVVQHFAGGTVGGILGIVASYPFDTVKVRMQTQPSPPIYRGMIHCFSSIIKQEGVGSLYRGMMSPVVGIAGIKAIVFGSYGYLQSQLLLRKQANMSNNNVNKKTNSNTLPKLDAWETTLASCGAGLAATLIVTPVERVKVALQSQADGLKSSSSSFSTGAAAKPYKGTIDCAMTLVRTQGIRSGLYKGFLPTVFRELPSYAFYFFSYEYAKQFFAGASGDVSKLSPGLMALSGGLAGIMAWIPIYPIDVVKSRIQAQATPNVLNANSESSQQMYRGFVDCVRRSYQAEGMSVFFRGLTPTIARAFPCHAAVFFGYEMVIKFSTPFLNPDPVMLA